MYKHVDSLVIKMRLLGINIFSFIRTWEKPDLFTIAPRFSRALITNRIAYFLPSQSNLKMFSTLSTQYSIYNPPLNKSKERELK